MPTPSERLAAARERLASGVDEEGYPLSYQAVQTDLLTIIAFDTEDLVPEQKRPDKPTPAKPVDRVEKRPGNQRPASGRARETR